MWWRNDELEGCVFVDVNVCPVFHRINAIGFETCREVGGASFFACERLAGGRGNSCDVDIGAFLDVQGGGAWHALLPDLGAELRREAREEWEGHFVRRGNEPFFVIVEEGVKVFWHWYRVW
jgi:hypothetical protein